MEDQNGLDAFAKMMLGDNTTESASDAPKPGEEKKEAENGSPEEKTGDPKPENTENDEIDELSEIEEGEEEGEPSTEGEQEGNEPAIKKFKVKVDGAELEVDEQELKNGYSRQEDYTRKTSKLADDRKSFEAEKLSISQERELYLEVLSKWETGVEAVLKEFLPDDMEALRSYDPEEYIRLSEKLNKHKQTLEMLRDERARVSPEIQKAQQQQVAAFVREQGEKVLELIPEWKDQKVREKQVKNVVEHAKKLGFTDQDINQTHNALVWKLVNDSRILQEIRNKRSALKPESRIQSAQPGTQSHPVTAKDKQVKAAARLSKSGNVKDFAAFIEAGMS